MSEQEQDTRPYVHDMHVSREAVDVIQACNERVNQIGLHWGFDSDRYRRAEQTWRRNLSLMFLMSFGADTRVTKDGPLSLFIATSSKFVYGLIFHAEQRACKLDGCKAYANDDGHVWHYGTRDNSGVLDHEHQWDYPLDWPAPGDWSFHS